MPNKPKQKRCGYCGGPVYSSAGQWFHDVYPRSIATRALEVSDDPFTTIALPDTNETAGLLIEPTGERHRPSLEIWHG